MHLPTCPCPADIKNLAMRAALLVFDGDMSATHADGIAQRLAAAHGWDATDRHVIYTCFDLNFEHYYQLLLADCQRDRAYADPSLAEIDAEHLNDGFYVALQPADFFDTTLHMTFH